MPEYGDHQYWDKRYQTDSAKTFDWLQDYKALKFVLEKICTRESKILMLGCGNALLSEDMYHDGYKNIYNIDISDAVIEQMKERNKDLSGMIYEVMDCTQLTYQDAFFDVVIDKSTIDALVCGNDPDLMVAKMMKEVQRVLKVSGTYCAISYGAPESRMNHYTAEHLAFEIESPQEVCKQEAGSKYKNTHYIYLCKKKEGADEVCRANWAKVEEQIMLGEEPAEIFKKKYLLKADNVLEGLSVKDTNYLYNDCGGTDSLDDLDFLEKMKTSYMVNEEVDELLHVMNGQSEKVCQV